MSPTKIFQSCGSSSSAVARSSRPTRVTRASFSVACTGPEIASACGTIARNFSPVNTRQSRPMRSCAKNIELLSSKRQPEEMIRHNGHDIALDARFQRHGERVYGRKRPVQPILRRVRQKADVREAAALHLALERRPPRAVADDDHDELFLRLQPGGGLDEDIEVLRQP